MASSLSYWFCVFEVIYIYERCYSTARNAGNPAEHDVPQLCPAPRGLGGWRPQPRPAVERVFTPRKPAEATRQGVTYRLASRLDVGEWSGHVNKADSIRRPCQQPERTVPSTKQAEGLFFRFPKTVIQFSKGFRVIDRQAKVQHIFVVSFSCYPLTSNDQSVFKLKLRMSVNRNGRLATAFLLNGKN